MRLQQHRMSTVLVFTLVFLLSTSASTFAAQPTVKITLWHHWAPELIGEVIAGFQLRYPWIEVEHITSDYSKAVDRMAVLLATGAAPEVMMVNSAYAYQFMSLGSFLLLDDLLTRDNIQLSIRTSGSGNRDCSNAGPGTGIRLKLALTGTSKQILTIEPPFPQ
jgi:ABC-type glycerol-3-phosphate transport system substrate-binding protein